MSRTAKGKTGSLGEASRTRGFLGSHRRLTAAGLAAAAALGIFGFLWFRPDKLLVDTRVNDALPSAASSVRPSPSGTIPGGGPAILSAGSFRSLEHQTTGVAKIVALADGSRFVRLEEFKTSSGPDVVVILSDTPSTENAWGAYDDGSFVVIGPLRGNVGNQNYAIPANVDLSQYRSVVIWCRRFTVGFGAAPLKLTA